MANLTLNEERRALKITEQAWRLPNNERRQFIKTACGNNPAMATLVEELLSTNVDQHFLSPDVKNTTPLPTEYENTEVGPYRVLQCIARGGMGDVYLAERIDGQFEKRVAIKFIRHDIDADLEKRFAIERQILAKLQHPNIAQLLDSGISKNGKSYYVMEYIDGHSLDEYCKSHNLNSRQILKIFIKVCSGISAAHRQLIIHRDLKPENILVTQEGEPKILDFGVAKILHREQQKPDSQTTIHPLTPRYASPEQLRQDFLGPATDIYSLGVILYELLSGLSPYGVESLSPLELSRRILEHIPKRPTRALSQLARPNTLKNTAAMLFSAGPRLSTDIDAILLKALEKEVPRRYASVEEFKADLEAYLEKMPVQARSPSTWYRLNRFIQRHKLSVSASAIAFIASAYAVTSNYINLKAMESQYLLSVAQREQIEQQSQQMQQQRLAIQKQEQALLEEQHRLADAYREVQLKNRQLQRQQEQQQQSEQQLLTLDQENDELKRAVEDLADKTSERIDRLFRSTPQYYQLLGNQYWPSREQAISTLLQQQADAERVFANQPAKKSELLYQLARLANRLELHATAIALAEKVDINSGQKQQSILELKVRTDLLKANSFLKLHKLDNSETLINATISAVSTKLYHDEITFAVQLEKLIFHTECLQLVKAERQIQALEAYKSNTKISPYQRASYYQTYGDYLIATKRLIAAGQAYQQALVILAEIDTEDPYAEPTAFLGVEIERGIARLQQINNEPELAANHLASAENQLKQHIGWANLQALQLQHDKIRLQLADNRFDQADDTLNTTLPKVREAVASNHPLYWEAAYLSSRYHQAMGLYNRALTDIESAFANSHPDWHQLGRYRLHQGDLLYLLGRYQHALEAYKQVDTHPNTGLTINKQLATSRTLAQLGQFDQALAILAQLNNYHEDVPLLDSQKAELNFSTGLYWELQGDEKQARTHYETALQMQEELYGSESLETIDLKINLSRVMLLEQRIQSAKNLNKQVLEIDKEILPYRHPQRVAAHKNIAAIETITDSYGRKRKANEAYIIALDAADAGAEIELTKLSNCYYYLVAEYSPRESKLFDYWFLQNGLFPAMPNVADAYEINDFAIVTSPFDYSKRMRREVIDCFSNLSEDMEISAQQRAIAAGYVGSLHLADENYYLAKNNLEASLQYFANEFGNKSPRARFLAKLLARAQY